MTTRIISLAIAAALATALPALAEEEGFSQFYRPADGRVGHVIVHERRDHMAPACLTEDDLDAFSYAVDTDDRARVLRMTNEGRCTFLPDSSWGEILGATPSGGGYLRLRMDYVHEFRDLDGIEVFVPVLGLRDLHDQGVQPWDQYHKVLGK